MTPTLLAAAYQTQRKTLQGLLDSHHRTLSHELKVIEAASELCRLHLAGANILLNEEPK
jgi:hypothetical protein